MFDVRDESRSIQVRDGDFGDYKRDGTHHIIFAGTALMDDSGVSNIWSPTLFRTTMESTDFVSNAASPPRGEQGDESKYLIQFSSPSLSAVAHAVVRVNLGQAVYLRLNSTVYAVISMDATENHPKQTKKKQFANINHDGCNNWYAF